MPNVKEPWFVVELQRSDRGLAAHLARDDVKIRRKKERDDSVDLWAEIADDHTTGRQFLVRVKGLLELSESNQRAAAKRFFSAGGTNIYLPALLVLVDVRDNRSSMAWISEPQIVRGQANIRFHRTPLFRELDVASVNTIIDRIAAWYDALPSKLVPA